MRKLLSLLIFCQLLFNSGFCQITNRISEKPDDLKDGIKTSTPAKEKMNAAVINEIIKGIDSGFYPNRHSLLIYKNDKLVLEKYFTGRDQKAWKGDMGVVDHNVNTLHDMRSVSKSVVSACIGIAICG